ncbi:unnamed protein product [Anisakis simplex]|uniref:Putative transporter (inferred by orthology to a C. elegans protein) n=1 Tax=Anisakis simplex TaxID=6269 RepID=A0A0M3K6B0_ANISI|nr:unnamed protein product [Anisakis simplex]
MSQDKVSNQVTTTLHPSDEEATVKYNGFDGEDSVQISDSKSEKDEKRSASTISEDEIEKTFTVDDAVEALGFGPFQMKLAALTGIVWMADAMEMTILAVILPALKCEWNISSFEQAMMTTIVFCGMMLSSTFWGNICDKHGRKKGLTCSAVMTFVMGSLCAISPNYYVLLILRGLTGFGVGGVPQCVTLFAEFLPIAHRAKCVLLIEAFWSFGTAFEAMLALLVMEPLGWRYLLFFSSMPLLIYCVCCFWLPESARYQVTCGDFDGAYKTLAKVAYENGRSLPQGRLINKTASGETTESTQQMGSIADLFVKDLRVTTILLWFIWCAISFIYYGLVLFTTVLYQSDDQCHGGSTLGNDTAMAVCRHLDKEDYFDILYTTLAEFPGIIVTAVVIELLGRKKTMGAEFGVFAIFTFLLFFCLQRRTVTIFIFVARAFIAGCFQCAYVYTPEVYPTTLRAVGLGTASGMARLGAILTPFISQVGAEVSVYIPIGVYGSVAVTGLIASFLLPIETKGRKMRVIRFEILKFDLNNCLYEH